MVQINFFALLSFLLFMSSAHAKVDAVICNGKVQSLDYLLIKDQLPYGELFPEKEASPGSLAQYLVQSIMLERAAPKLRPLFNVYSNNFKNHTDFSMPMVWQASSLSFPKEILSVKDWPQLAECAKNGKIEALTIVHPSQQGQMIIFEFDQKLFSALSETSNLQFSFLFTGTFLRLLSNNLESLSQINALLNSMSTMSAPTQTLSDLFIKYGMKELEATGVCQRSPLVVEGLQKGSGLPCESITPDDLAQISKLKIEGKDSSETQPFVFQSGDLSGLTSLQELSIKNFSNGELKITPEELSDLNNLKKLTISGLHIDLVPKSIMLGLKNIEYLDLTNNEIYEFKEDAFKHIFIQEPGKVAEVVLDLTNNNSQWKPAKRLYLHPGAFNNCQAVTKLLMKNINITKLEEGVFTSLTSLRELDLSDNPVAEFPWEVLDLPNLKTVHYCYSSRSKKTIDQTKAELLKRNSKVEVKWCD